MRENDAMTVWWGPRRPAVGETIRWEIGQRSLWVSRSSHEWRVATTVEATAPEGRFAVAEPCPAPESEDLEVHRFSVSKEDQPLQLLPALPERPLVVRPSAPFSVSPSESATLFISSPLWFRLSVGSGQPLMDEPIVRPSDSWFGPDTMTGEICYSSKMSARLQLENLPQRPGRAICTVRIRNASDVPLALERIKIPVPNLSLFSSPDGHLWTESLTLERSANGEESSTRLDKKSKLAASTLVAPPRSPHLRSLVDVFGGIFSRDEEASHG